MYCPSCGSKGKHTDIYCGECGTKLERKKINFKLSKKVVTILISLLVAILVLFGLYETGNYVTSPSYLATKYFKAAINNDVDGIYSYIDEDESLFVTKDILKDKMVSYGKISSYEVTNVEVTNTQALVEFTYNEDGTEKIAYVLLNKSGNKYLFYKNWEISSGKVVSNVTFRVQKDSKFTIDDIDLSKYLKEDDNDEYYDTYVVPYMINGTYNVKNTLSNGIQIDVDSTFNSNNTYTVSNVAVSDDLASSLSKTILDNLNSLYSSALKGSDYDSIKGNYTNDLKTVYNSIKRSISSNVYTVNGFEYTDVVVKGANLNSKGKVVVTVVADYKMNYTVKETSTTKDSYNSSVFSVEVDDNYNIVDISNTIGG